MGRVRMMSGMGSRVAASIVTGAGWLIFVLLYAGFWSAGYTLFQSVIIFLISLIVLVGILGVMWAPWGMRFARW